MFKTHRAGRKALAEKLHSLYKCLLALLIIWFTEPNLMVQFRNGMSESPTVTWKTVILGTGLSYEGRVIRSRTLSFASRCVYITLRRSRDAGNKPSNNKTTPIYAKVFETQLLGPLQNTTSNLTSRLDEVNLPISWIKNGWRSISHVTWFNLHKAP